MADVWCFCGFLSGQVGTPSDETRMGALRFAVSEDGLFVADDKELAAPPWTTLCELEAASLAFEHDDGLDEKWLRQLLAPGSSWGGARPKASVVAPYCL